MSALSKIPFFRPSRSAKTPMIQRSLRILAAAAILPGVLVARETLVIKAKHAYLGRGKTMKNVVVVVEGGKISKIGQGLEADWNARVLETDTIMPAWVHAHFVSGMDQTNENMPVTPQLTVADSIDPSHSMFELMRRHGAGTLHVIPGDRTVVAGFGMVVRPAGTTPEEMAVVSKAGLKMSLAPRQGSRSAQIAAVEKALDDAIDYRKDWERKKAEFEEDKKNGATTKEEFDEEIDEVKKPLLDLLDGKATAYIAVPSAADVRPALQIVSKYRLQAVLVLGNDTYKAADLLRRSRGIPLVLDADLEIVEEDEKTGKEVVICPAKKLFDAGLKFAVTSKVMASGRRRGRSSSSNPAPMYPW
jgi:imidazolonepropionase-like amidohydrolase